MRVIGILGGIASGKSFVSQEFARLGAWTLDADRMGHEVLRDPEVVRRLTDRWGEGILGADGQMDRSRIAEIVFTPPHGEQEREYLEQVVHPGITARLEVELEQASRGGAPAAILDAALLLEVGWDKLCDRLVFVDAPRPLRAARAARRGWSETDFADREGVQESLDSKREHADVIIDNSGSPEQTRSQVERIWRHLIG